MTSSVLHISCISFSSDEFIKFFSNHEKSRNSLTLLKEINNNIFILFKRSYFLKYSSYNILSMRQRISLICYMFPLFLNLFCWQSEISERLKNLKISKFWETNLKSENLEIFGTNLKIWKSEKSPKFWKTKFKIWKSEFFRKCLIFVFENRKSFFFLNPKSKFQLFSIDYFFFKISRTFFLSIPLCLFCMFVLLLQHSPLSPPPLPNTTPTHSHPILTKFWISIFDFRSRICLQIRRFPSAFQIFKLVFLISRWVSIFFYTDWCKRSDFEARNFPFSWISKRTFGCWEIPLLLFKNWCKNVT